MSARDLLETVTDWFTGPGSGAIFYQCRSCGATFDVPQSECYDCGGEIDELPAEPSPPYVGPMG